MGDFQEIAQSVFIGLIFSFLVAKLISMVISFRDENLKVVREKDLEPVQNLLRSSNVEESIVRHEPSVEESGEAIRVGKEEERGESVSGVTELQSSSIESLLGEDDDDWEGVESTELDEAFSAATAFVAAAAADRLSQKVPSDVQLQLYGFYKIATEGPCTIPQPSALKISARAKWNAWQRLGAMPTEEAMEKYIMIVCELYPTWASGVAAKKHKVGDIDAPSSAAKGPMGPVFSTFVHEEESDNEMKLEAIHVSAREGEVNNLIQYMENGVSVNLKDSEGRTPLHWAVDRGHLDVVELLIGRDADVNAKDNEGQTPLHYAVMCEREAIAKFLIKYSADTKFKDNDDNTPCDLCESAWSWMINNQ